MGAVDRIVCTCYTVSVPTSSQIQAFINAVLEALQQNQVELSRKALDEIEEMDMPEEDAFAALEGLNVQDFLHTEPSQREPGVIIWVFCPIVARYGRLWIRLVRRKTIIFFVISLHPEGMR